MKKSWSLIGLLVLAGGMPAGANMPAASADGLSAVNLPRNSSLDFDRQGGDEDARRALALLALADAGKSRYPVAAHQLNQQVKLTASDGAMDDYFGTSVALSADGNTAIAGAYLASVDGNLEQGAAYVFTRSGTSWEEQAKLTASDGAERNYFGVFVALSEDGNTAIIGAPNVDVGGNTQQGAAYVFTRSGSSWSQQVRLIAADGSSYDTFGQSVALSADGNTAIAGAYQVEVGGNTGQGAAYVFARSGTSWEHQAKLTASDGAENDRLGGSVAMSADGNTAIAGAYNKRVGGNTGQGAAYVFARSGASWSQQAKLVAADGAQGDWFGQSGLSADGNTAIIGAYLADVGGKTNQGAAYVFTRAGSFWCQQAKLVAADGALDDYFGKSVAISADGGAALVGADGAAVGENLLQGAAYVFARSGASWNQQAKLTASDGAGADQFGVSVALSADGNTALAGGSHNNAAYVFAAGTIQFAASTYNAREDAGSVAVSVTRANDASGTASVNYATADGTAKAGTDYTASDGALTWADGDMSPKTFNVKIINRAGQQAWRAFTVRLSGVTGASLGLPATAAVAIADSGTPAAPTGVSASEGMYIDRVLVAWNAAAGAAGYQVWRGAADDSVAAGLIGLCSGTAYTDNDAGAGTRYYYWVKATNAFGASAFSASAGGSAMPVGPAIRANGATGNVAVAYPGPVTVTMAMNAGMYAGVGIDWWGVARAHSGEWYYLNSAMVWTPFNGDLAFCRPAYQGALFDLPWIVALDGYQLPAGIHDFWFAVDYPMDGIVNLDGQILLDQVSVAVE